jgi:hypothetical protein
MSKKGEERIESQYRLDLAGRIWIIPEIRLHADVNGDKTIQEADLERSKLSIANWICHEDCEMRAAEFEFLCELSQTSYKEIATYLHKDKSTVSRWANKQHIDYAESRLLKDFFWRKLFGELNRLKDELAGRRESTERSKGLPPISSAS